MEAWQLWTIIGFFLLIIEIFATVFVLCRFGLGAFGGGLAASWGYSLSVHLIVFSVITLAIFFGIRPLYLKYLKRFEADHKTGVLAFIGKQYKVTETIDKITEAIAASKGDPANYLIAIRYIEALKEMVTGKDNKVVYLPYEATGVLSSIGGIKEMLTANGKG